MQKKILEEKIYFGNQINQLAKGINRIKYIKQKISNNKTLQQNSMFDSSIFKELKISFNNHKCKQQKLNKTFILFNKKQSNHIQKHNTKFSQRNEQNQIKKNQKIEILRKNKQQNYRRIKNQRQILKLNKQKQATNSLLEAKIKREKVKILERQAEINIAQQLNSKLDSIKQQKLKRNIQNINIEQKRLIQKIQFSEIEENTISKFQNSLLIKQKLKDALMKQAKRNPESKIMEEASSLKQKQNTQ